MLVAGAIATHLAAPNAITAQVTAGSIGVLFIVFGSVFSRLEKFPLKQRARLVLVLFPTFCVFILVLLVTTIWAARAENNAISGVVVDEADTAVDGAIVSIDGIPEINDQTPPNGNFFISIPARDQRRNEYVVRARKGELAGKQTVAYKSITNVITIRVLPAPPPVKPERVPGITTSVLPSGHVTLFDGFRYGDLSTFTFRSASILPWGSPADIGVASPPSTSLAEFFLPNAQPPYSSRQPTLQDIENAGIVDMGTSGLDEILEAPDSGYEIHYFPPEAGHVYCLRTRDGQHFAKIKITYVGSDRVAFDYVYQPSGSRSFK